MPKGSLCSRDFQTMKEAKPLRLTRSPKPTLHNAVKITILRPVILIILLIGLVVIWIDFPLTPERVTAASVAAIPAPTPPDKETIDALVDQLKEAIADPVDDEDVVNSIIERWDRRVLIGKTKKQVIDMFFADVKAIVKKKATQDAVWEAWSDLVAEADADEPVAPIAPPSRPRAKPSPKAVEPDEPDAPSTSPSSSKAQPSPKAVDVNEPTEKGIDAPLRAGQWVLTDEKKRNSGATEMVFFRSAYDTVRTWYSEPRQYKGYSYSISIPTDPIDPNAQAKVAGIDKAVKTVVDNGFALPYDLQFFCSPVEGALTQAFKRGENWAPVAYIFLGPGGSPKALSSTAAGFNGFDTRTIRTIHEIGHIIHERQAGDTYWQSGRTINTAASSQVSQYGCCNEKEFVAEVFAGMMIGKRWSNEVLAEYRKWLGPRPTIF